MTADEPPPFQWLRQDALSGDRPLRAPISIYVMWHPRFEDGPTLARSVAEWWGGVADIRAAGLGIPVHFRSAPWGEDHCLPGEAAPEKASGSRDPRLAVFRRPIDLGAAEDNIFVPIVDDHMVEDPSWRRDLLDLARKHVKTREGKNGSAASEDGARTPVEARDGGIAPRVPRVHFAPIQVTSAWARMPPEVSAIKALYLERWSDSASEWPEARRDRRCRRLRRLLTQALVRLLRERDRQRFPTEIFLSHAKADLDLGPGVAERLRDVAASYGQIEVFYDENDLPSGADWKRAIDTTSAQGAGFIAVLSDRYATRYWCRREIQFARTPRRADTGKQPRPGDVWTIRPSVVAVTMSSAWSRLIGDLGTVPAIRWNPDDVEHAAGILDQLFREALIAEFHRRYADGIRERIPAAFKERIELITWTPDAASLTRLRKAAKETWRDDCMVAYPGHGFLPTEKDDLAGTLGADVPFRSFEELADAIARGPAHLETCFAAAPDEDRKRGPLGPMIALSVGDADDLAVLGYDSPSDGTSLHVDVAVLRLVRVVLGANCRLGYGGVLRDSSNFTQLLFDTVAGMSLPEEPDPNIPSEIAADPETVLENWIAAPYASRYPVGEKAGRTGLCRFRVIGTSAAADAGPAAKAVHLADSLQKMRESLAADSALTIALAGKRSGFSGWMPGVAEEVTAATQFTVEDAGDQVRILLLGEYGGVSREIVRYVLDPAAKPALPPCLDLEQQKQLASGSVAEIARGGPDALQALTERYATMRRALDVLRAVASQAPSTLLTRLGLTVGEWRNIMTTSSIGYVRRLLKDKVLPRIIDPSPRPAS